MTKKIVQSVVKTRRTRKRSSTILWNKSYKSKNARNRIEFQRVHRVGKREPAIRTDHAAITLVLGDTGEIKGPGIWKMNVSLLEDENYLEQLNKRVKLICLTNNAFGTGSNTIRLHAISYSKEKAKLK
ncbi:unnamed protein product [Porites lobata]|uniref:Uncharacterized protein n=1 Tax=Porites lobata TaxID=104759 RepID=A0ABN8RVH7_9CNID|nr:unnamed protein product [Porites lobata]